MEIKITTSVADNIADSISGYIFTEVKTVKEKQNMGWLSKFTAFYQGIKNGIGYGDYTYAEIDDSVKNDLAEMIEKHMFEDIDNASSQIMFEMVGIYNQIKNESTDMEDEKSADGSDRENYDSEFKYENTEKEDVPNITENSSTENVAEKSSDDGFVMINEDDEGGDNGDKSWEYDHEDEEIDEEFA